MLALLVAGAALGSCRPAEPANETAPDDDAEPVLNIPVPRPDPPLGRAELLAAVAQAASAAAAGSDDSAAQRALDGRQFELRIRFGCRGPVAELDGGGPGWSYDPERRRLRVRARPTITSDEPLTREVGAGEFEAVEGFWIPRPWLLQPTCPAAVAVRAAPPPDGEPVLASPVFPRVGIAQFFTEADPRTGRRDSRPYESVKVLEEGQPLSSQGYTLVLSGRLRSVTGMGVIGCVSKGADAPPDCIVSADFDRVWIERPDGGEIIAEWRSS